MANRIHGRLSWEYMDVVGHKIHCYYTVLNGEYYVPSTLFILLIRGLSLPGASLGLTFLFSSASDDISSLKLWSAAAEQVLFEIGVGVGAVFSISAYSRFRNNVYRDAALLITMVEMLASAAMNLLHSRNRRLNSRLIAGVCCLGFLLEIPICSSGGFFLFHSMDSLISSLSTFILSFLLLVTTSYLYGLNKFLSDISSMLRIPRRTKAKWGHLHMHEKLMELLGPCGTFVRLSWGFVCPCFLMVLMVTHAVSYRRPLFFGCHVPVQSELFAWILVYAPLSAALVGVILAVVKIRKSGKKISTLFDASAWHQEITTVSYDDSPPPTPSGKTQPKRENTYMVRKLDIALKSINRLQYIDPASRGPTVRSVFQSGTCENYAWKTGRLKDWQETVSLDQSVNSQPSFAASIASQGTLTLFGSPPVSNGFMASDANTLRTQASTSKCDSDTTTTELNTLVQPRVVLPPSSPIPQRHSRMNAQRRKLTCSEPPIKISSGLDLIPSTPPPRISPCRSEPPGMMTDRPAPSVRSKSASHDGFSDSDSESGK
ncbi:Sodium:neurotransmitter symporter family protein [Oesophagostomum dentatum]|uniref:Sodium:neurotransmitter symporter family protein n=1 Tax=Oesophagostomum dentatum TaxID=61180 RepID=A0A0B1STU8_OESDE|nr:Sodium:neurotransmitter symporter family protein [Oesophagostomum dentatum]